MGAVVRTVAARRAEGVFSVRAEFTPCGRYVLYYHSKRRTLREETVAKVMHMFDLVWVQLDFHAETVQFKRTPIVRNAF